MSNASNGFKSFGNDRVSVTIYDDKSKSFTVRNKLYRGVGSLQNGFLVLHASELFPCFDSSDYLYENRFYHWFFVCASLSEYFAVKKQLKYREIPLRQFYADAILHTWEKYYSGLRVPMVYCRDDSQSLIVVENL